MLSRRLFLAAFFATSTWIVNAAGDEGEGSSHGGGNANPGGGGNGQGGGNANPGGGGNGQGGGNANPGGGGNGQGGGNANPGGGGTEEESEQPPQPVEQPSAVHESYTAIPSGPLRVRHRNGFEEEIGAGRYKMHDNRGRLIVNRVVRSSDYVRLRRLITE